MLVRSAGRRHERRTSQLLAASFAQLNLPWLAPAQLRWTASASTRSSPSSINFRRSNRPRTKPHIRSLATAADHHTVRSDNQVHSLGYGSSFRNASADKNVPFDFSPAREPASFPNLGRPKNPPVMLQTTTKSPGATIRVAPGLSGTVGQLHAHLDTSLRVGRQERAEAIVRRLTEQCGPKAPESIRSHEIYLQHQLTSLILEGRDSPQSSVLLREMQRWFEVEIRNKDVQLSPKLLIIMTRAVIRALAGSRRERSIRRYIEMTTVLGDDVIDEVLNSDDYDDNEHAILGRAIPEIVDAVDEPEESALVQERLKMETAEEHYVRKSGIEDLETIPEVLATEQKGTGLENIKKTMATFTSGPVLSEDATREERKQLARKRQLQLEQTSVEVAIEKWREADEALRKIGIVTSMQTRPVAALMWQWYQAFVPLLEKELAEVREVLASPTGKGTDRHAYGPYLELLPLKQIAATTILYTMSRMNSGKDRSTKKFEQDIKLAMLTTGLANAIEAECVAGKQTSKRAGKTAQTAHRQKELVQNGMQEAASDTNVSKRGEKGKKVKAAILADMDWPMSTKVQLGAMLLSKLIESAQLPVTREDPRSKKKVTQLQPAFLHRIKFQHGKKIGFVTPNPALTQKLQSEPVGSLIAKRMPMVVEPKPWKGWNDGGYLHYPNPIVRLPHGDTSGKDYFMAADARKDLGRVYKGLTSLSKVPWKVHRDVFRVQLEAWNSGEQIANFAPLHSQLEKPVEPEGVATDPVLRRRWLNDLREIKNREGGLHSQRCFQNFQMEIARTVINETLYFPHNLDFRGRAYPIPPYLNHMGADNVRGLLTFAEGKELGENGLRWLKIHLATVAGHDKASMDERVAFTEAHLEDIYDSVRRPLDGRRWWLKADDAWQTLAACFELTYALDSPDPTKFVSHLPVQQDGTCNGLQHYAALGGDKAGAQQVNLEPGDRPADVYTAVLKAVEEEVEADAKLGNPIAQKLHGRLTRKCVKQPVMTNVYGVTFYGARLQVAKQLEPLFPDVGRHDAITINKMAHYIATKIFKSLGTMFAGAQAIQTWLGQCADRISTCITPEQVEELINPRKEQKEKKRRGIRSKKEREQELVAAADNEVVAQKSKKVSKKSFTEAERLRQAKPSFKSTVIWTTPLRLPVVQPYRKSKMMNVSTGMQSIALADPHVWDPVSKRKQLQAFPPNFIHSLDATHMLLSATQCNDNGMTFASIHDSFWTHASDVDRMSDVLRDAFVAMHKEDIVGRLREEFQARYKNCMYLAAVTAHSAVGQKVIAQRARMRKEKKLHSRNELAVEAERMRLCNSENPEERAQGEAMVTPGSIVASEADELAFSIPTELAGQAIGDIPATALEVDADGAGPDAPLVHPTASLSEQDSGENTSATRPDELNAVTADEAGAEQVAEESKATAAADEHNKGAKIARKIYVWLPVTFPEVPQKGDFQVERLLQSRYFFH